MLSKEGQQNIIEYQWQYISVAVKEIFNCKTNEVSQKNKIIEENRESTSERIKYLTRLVKLNQCLKFKWL